MRPHFEKILKYTGQLKLLPDNGDDNDSMSIGSESIEFSVNDALVQSESLDLDVSVDPVVWSVPVF